MNKNRYGFWLNMVYCNKLFLWK